jgi:hypothetical protein
MQVALHSGHESDQFDSDKNHRTLVLKLSNEKANEIWKISRLTQTEHSLTVELTLSSGVKSE